VLINNVGPRSSWTRRTAVLEMVATAGLFREPQFLFFNLVE
jgi:hypothetical protein